MIQEFSIYDFITIHRFLILRFDSDSLILDLITIQRQYADQNWNDKKKTTSHIKYLIHVQEGRTFWFNS